MVLNVILLLVGIALLYLGSDWMVRGAAALAISLSVRPIIVGLTVVAFATSAPELLVSLIAAVKGASGVSLGNVLGSNVANIGLVLGLSALVRPLAVDQMLLQREMPFLIGISGVFWLVCLDGRLGRINGALLLSGLVFFLALGILTSGKGSGAVSVRRERRLARDLFLILVGTAGLLIGADLIVRSAVFIATRLGLSELFVGLSIVAVGTSLPELATSVVAGARGEHELSIGNVVGSNVFNICMVMGTVGLFNPMPVDMALMRFEFPAMFILALFLFVFSRTGFLISRVEGFLLVLSYCAFVGVSYLLAAP